MRGCGESRPCQVESDLSCLFGSLYPAYGRMLGETFLHGQIRDVIAVLKLLKNHGCREVVLIAEGAMCAVAEAAAERSPVTLRLKLRNPSMGRKKFLLDPKAVLPPAHCLFER